MNQTPEHYLGYLNTMRGREDKTLDIAIEEHEKKIEKDTCKILYTLGIGCSVKTLRKTLPYQYEVKGNRHLSSFMNESINVKFLQRKLLKELLNDSVFKIRMYCDIEFVLNYDGRIKELEYRLRYYRHE